MVQGATGEHKEKPGFGSERAGRRGSIRKSQVSNKEKPGSHKEKPGSHKSRNLVFHVFYQTKIYLGSVRPSGPWCCTGTPLPKESLEASALAGWCWKEKVLALTEKWRKREETSARQQC